MAAKLFFTGLAAFLVIWAWALDTWAREPRWSGPSGRPPRWTPQPSSPMAVSKRFAPPRQEGSPAFSPVIGAGYQAPGLALDFPSTMGTDAAGSTQILPGMRLDLKNSHCWVGLIGLDMKVYGGLGIFLGAETNVTGKMSWLSNLDSLADSGSSGGSSTLDWKGADFEWMAGEGGLSYAFGRTWDARVGLRLDEFSVNLRSPVASGTAPLPGDTGFDGRGEFHSRLWIPYGAIRFRLPGSKATLYGSPLLYGDMNLAFTRTASGRASDSIFRNQLLVNDVSGYFLEAAVEHRVRTFMGINVVAWARASMTKSRSPATLRMSETATQGSQVDDEAAWGCENATLFRQTLGGGLCALLAF